jgi:hypothetical protein
MAITVAVPAAMIKLNRASLNRGNRITPEMSEAVMFINMVPSGQITAKKRKTPSINFVKPNW